MVSKYLVLRSTNQRFYTMNLPRTFAQAKGAVNASEILQDANVELRTCQGRGLMETYDRDSGCFGGHIFEDVRRGMKKEEDATYSKGGG